MRTRTRGKILLRNCARRAKCPSPLMSEGLGELKWACPLCSIAPCAVQGIFPGLLIASEPYIIFAACLQFFEGACSFRYILPFQVFLEILAGAYLYLISGSPLVLCPLYR